MTSPLTGTAGARPASTQAPPGAGTSLSAGTSSAAGVEAGYQPHRQARPARFADAIRSEWTKTRTVRSTYASLVAAAVLMVGVGALISFAVGNHYQRADLAERLTFDPTGTSLTSIIFAQLAVAVFAILLVTAEYQTGMIRTSLQAVPRRPWLLGAKALVFAAMALVVGEIICFASFFVGQPLLKAGPAPYATIGQPGVARAVALSGVYLVLSGLIAMGVGALVRHTAAAITVIVAVYFVLPGVAQALPQSWSRPVEKFIPTGGGRAMAAVLPNHDFLSPWWGLILLCGYVVVVLGAGFVTMQRRDA
jgi:ABC-2 type transport system permease protein